MGVSMETRAQAEKRIKTVGEQWTVWVEQMVQRRFTGQKWLRFAAQADQRFHSPRAQFQQAPQREAGAVDLPAPLAAAAAWAGTPAIAPADTWSPGVASDDDAARSATSGRVPPSDLATQNLLQPPGRLFAAQVVTADGQAPPARGDAVATATALPIGAGARPLPATVAKTMAFPVAPRLLRYLEQVLEIQIPTVKIYANQAADEVVRHFGADAVTYGDNILFRTDKYNPTTPEGLGLLAHEVTHAAAHRPGQAAITPAGDAEEAAALQNEQRVRQAAQVTAPVTFAPLSLPAPAAPPHSVLSAPEQPEATPATTAVTAPHTALAGRPTGATPMSSPMGGTNGGGMQIAEQELTRIKEEVYRYLMAKITTEFERGA